MPQNQKKADSRGRKKQVVVIGGGSGTYQTLLGLKNYPFSLSAVVTMADSGGSSGRLRKSFKILPPGDVRQALLALSCLPISQRMLEKLFAFRFENGDELAGHSVGNLILAALTQITGSEEEAIAQAEKLLVTCGHVYPVTMGNTHLVAELENGKSIYTEGKIDTRAEGKNPKNLSPIKRVYLKPNVAIYEVAEKTIKNADVIILSAGDLYTSLIPNLLVQGVTEAIAASKAKVILVVNLMTKPGETDGYKASDFVRVVKSYMGVGSDKLGYIVINKSGVGSRTTLARYKKEGQEPIDDDLNHESDKIIRADLAQKGDLVRHDPEKLAEVIEGIIN